MATASQTIEIYNNVLFRNPTDAELASFVANSQTAQTEQNQIDLLVNSSEAQTYVYPVISLYQATYGRVPDAGGLNFWVDYYRNAVDNGVASITALNVINEGFVQSSEFTALYPEADSSGMITEDLLTAVYQNVLGRAPDDAGREFWLDGTKTIPELLSGFALSSETLDSFDPYIDLFLSKAAAGTQDYQQSLLDANDDGQVNQADVDAVTPDNTTTTALTTGIDTINGTEGKDVISGVLSTNSTETTFNIADQVNGGGGEDTLNVTVLNNKTNYEGLSTKNVEVLNFASTDTDVGTNTTGVNVSNFEGATQVWAKGGNVSSTNEDTLNLTGIKAGTTLGVANNSASLNVNFTSTNTATSGDTVNFVAGGGATGDVTINDAATDGYETAKVTTMTGATTLDSFTSGSDFKNLSISGDQALTIKGELASTVKSIDASANSGAINLTAAASSTLTAKGGSGDADTLNLNVSSSVTTGMAISGFETVGLQASSSATVDLDLISDGTVSVRGSTTDITGTTLTLQDAAAGADLKFVGTGKDAAQFFNAVTYNQKGAATGTTESVAIKIGNAGTAVSSTNLATTGVITAANIETVSLDVADFSKVNSELTIANAKSLTLTGSAELDLATFTGSADLATIDAGGYTGKLTLGTLTDVTGNLTYTGSTGVDVLQNAAVAATKTQTFNLGTGNDIVTVTDPAAANATVSFNGEAGDDTFTAENVDTGVINISGGEGNDKLITGATGATEIDLFSGVEVIQLSGDNSVDLKVGNGYNDAVQILEVSGGNADLDFITAESGGSLDASNFTFVGWDAANDVLKLTGTTGSETITGSSVNDVITGGTAGDLLDGKSGNDTYVIAQNDTGTIGTITNNTGNATGAVEDGDTIAVDETLVDRITFVDGDDMLDLDVASGDFSAATVDEGSTTYGVGDDEFATIRGNFNAGTNTFTADSSAGADVLFIYDADSGATTDIEAVILVGAGGATIDGNDIVA
ncbi:MAG: DUF4214 domain-containing protein [Pseudomonadota bacterium]|nr:DUF4214 domain-containing protein [Pseudomonadota bacterium]